MQVIPDYTRHGTGNELESELSSTTCKFIFTGCGFYLTNTDTLLIVPAPSNTRYTTTNKPWAVKQGRLQAHVYNCPLSETIFGQQGNIPTRQDDRS